MATFQKALSAVLKAHGDGSVSKGVLLRQLSRTLTEDVEEDEDEDEDADEDEDEDADEEAGPSITVRHAARLIAPNSNLR